MSQFKHLEHVIEKKYVHDFEKYVIIYCLSQQISKIIYQREKRIMKGHLLLETEFLGLLFVAMVVAMLARRFRFPYTIALVATGLALGFFNIVSAIHLTPDLLFMIFLPVLLYEAAFHVELSDFLKNAKTIILFAIPGVMLATVIAGALVYWARPLLGDPGLPFVYALLFGAVTAATDPISVLAIFKKMGVSRKLSLIMEGESLLNDGAAVVLFGIILMAIKGQNITVGIAIFQFFKVVFGGLIVGLVLGFIFSLITAQIDDHLVEITLTTILAYGSYLVAEHFHVSGVIAVVAAGMMTGNFGTKIGMSPTTRVAVNTFWEYLAFVANSIIFILIGIELKIDSLLLHAVPALIAWLAVVLARGTIFVFFMPLVRWLGEKISYRWGSILFWGGIRGSLSMVLVLGLPSDFPHRELFLNMTFGVVFFSLFIQGFTISGLAKKLGLVRKTEELKRYEELRGSILAIKAALEDLKKLHETGTIPASLYKKLKKEYEDTLVKSEKELETFHLENEEILAEQLRSLRRHLLFKQKDALKEAFSKGLISSETMSDILKNIDLKLDLLEES